MSNPFFSHDDPIHGAVAEIISGISSLNMEPEPVENPRGPYISDLDRNVNHAMRHFDAAIALLQRAESLYRTLRYFRDILEDSEAEIRRIVPGQALAVFDQAMRRLEDKSLPEAWLRGPQGPKDWLPGR